MTWDLGLQGLGVLAGAALLFGVIAQLVAGRHATRWMWAIASATYFVSGLIISEMMFGWATVDDLQPNIDGLSADEALLFALIPGIVVVLLVRYLTRPRPAPATG